MIATQQEVGKRRQVGVHPRSRHLRQHVMQLVVADVGGATRQHEVRLAAGGLRGKQVAQRVRGHRHLRQVDTVAASDLEHHARLGLAAGAAVLGRVRAEEDGVDAPTLDHQQLVDVRMHGIDRSHVDHAAADAGLVGGHHHMPAGVVQPRHRRQRAGHGLPTPRVR